LLDQQRKRRAVLARISDRITAKRQEITQLRRDERRLSRLIDGLGRIIAKQKRARPAKNTAWPVRVETTPDADTRHPDAFARLKGRLRLPVPGELVHRYGTPRSEGGTTWKGVFIRARNGTEIKAIAGGRVVFSDWLRGFGNLIILDHGDGYLSVYGNNESIFVKPGQETRPGEVLAAVGNSGGNAETGLYFELRHLGQPLDPLKWLILR
jgi:septal ring factor EnvC (AmiA/AmiB activator)